MNVQELIDELMKTEDKTRKVICFQGAIRFNDLQYGEVKEVSTSQPERPVRIYFNP